MVELTAEQHQSIIGNGNEPLRAIDPATKAEYVLVRAEIYDRFRAMLSDELGWQDAAYASAMEVFARDGWDDPRMDVYDTLEGQDIP